MSNEGQTQVVASLPFVEFQVGGPGRREHIRRMRIRLAALRRHAAARDPLTGKSSLAVAAGKASGRRRICDRAWGLEYAMRRWYPEQKAQSPNPPNTLIKE